MGLCSSLPPADDRMKRVEKTYYFTKSHLRKFWALFLKYDFDRSGTMDVKEFYELINEPPSVFVDSLFTLVETRRKGELEFSEFVETIALYCTFGREDILKFCFFIFDKDKNGVIDKEELVSLVSILHDHAVDKSITRSIEEFDTNRDGVVSFPELCALHKNYPQVLFPAFRIQANLMLATFGQSYWVKRREVVSYEKNKEKRRVEEAKKQEALEKRRMQMAEVERRMGACQYFCCFWKRREILKDILRAQMAQEKRELEEQRLAAVGGGEGKKGDEYDDEDYNSSEDDLDKHVVDAKGEGRAKDKRQAMRKDMMKREVKGVAKPSVDLDRDRRERRRDVRGETDKHELVKHKDKYTTQEERAQKYRADKSKKPPAVGSPERPALRSPTKSSRNAW